MTWKATTVVVVLLASLLTVTRAEAAPTGTFSSTPMYFSVHVGPNGDTPCTVVGELFVPDAVSETDQAPAVLTTHGFGGSYQDQIPTAQFFAREGYVALAYSGLGFGGSTCRVSLDDPDTDGVAASQLVSFLGGASGIGFRDRSLTQPAPLLTAVERDAVDHDGVPQPNDPRIGMIGGSYGGGIQFAAASVDPRIDTIVPIITWNDLSYSLAPNSTSAYSGVSTSMPGSAKVLSALGLFVSGSTRPGSPGFLEDPARLEGCPNFVDYMCGAIAQAVTVGDVDSAVIGHLRHASVTSYVDRIKVPVLLAQGQQDTLFDLNEAVATRQALLDRGVDVKMIWQSWGHSHLEPVPGEFSQTDPDPHAQYETGRFLDWFDHYLKDESVDTGPEFAYFRDWVPYSGNAEPAYAASPAFPVGAERTAYLSTGGQLIADGSAVVPQDRTLVTGPAGLPTGIEPPTQSPDAHVPDIQLPGTELFWSTTAMTHPTDVVGIPTMSLTVSSPGPATIYAKLYDVAPDGTATIVGGHVSPIRFADSAAPLGITLPGIVHRFDTGHSLRLSLTGGDISFRGGMQSVPVTVRAGELRLPAL